MKKFDILIKLTFNIKYNKKSKILIEILINYMGNYFFKQI